MACSNPIRLYSTDIKKSKYNNHSDFTNEARRRSFGHQDYFEVPCYHCLNCRTDRVNQFIDRAEYEYLSYGCGAFVTFTYDDTHLFQNSFIDSHTGKTLNTINKKDGKDFLNRLNKLVHAESDRLKKLGLPDTMCRKDYKYVISSEYGDRFQRSHFHCLFFGLDFAYCERLFWRAWNYKGSIQVGPIKNGGIGYVVKYINESSHGIDDFYKYTYHHLERPSSSHSLKFGDGLYLSQLDHIKKTGCYSWHNKERPVPSYYKNKYNIISDLSDEALKKKYTLQKENIYNLYEKRIKNYADFKQWNYDKAIQREKNIKIKLRQAGKQIENNSLLALERQCISAGVNRLPISHDNSVTSVLNNRGDRFLSYRNQLIPYPLTNTSCLKYFHCTYNDLKRAFGTSDANKLFGIRDIPF